MKDNMKKHNFNCFCLDLLQYKKGIMLINIVCNVIIFSRQAAITFFTRQILNGITQVEIGQALSYALPYLLGIIIVTLIRIVAIMACACLDKMRSYYYQNRTRLNIIKALLSRKNATSVTGNANRIFEVLDDDIPISTFPAELLTEVSGFVIYTIIALSMLLSINWALTLFIFVPLSASIYGVGRLSERMKEKRRANRSAHDDASSFISDIADTALAIKVSGTEQAVLNQYSKVNKARRKAVLQDTIFNERVSALLEASVCIGSAIMMFIAARLIAGNSFGIGDFSLFIAHLGTLANCTNRIVELVYEARKAEVSFERITEHLTHEDIAALSYDTGITLRHIAESETLPYPYEQLSSFEVKNLTFRYDDGTGFQNVSFFAKLGELIVIAGGMASGKSTLLSTLAGLIPPESGTILWNNISLWENVQLFTSARVTAAPQRGGFFSDDIKTNIQLGQRIEEKEIEMALYISMLDETISSMPNGMKTVVGSKGSKLSGGQCQRLALARMLARGSSIYIIDDCISALDERTKAEVLQRLTTYLKATGRTVIIATNSPSFLKAADKIIVMDKGNAFVKGSYAELDDSLILAEGI